MAYSQADIDALRAAIATGAKRVKFGSGPDSREVEYRTLAEMKQVLADMLADTGAATEPNRIVGAYFSGLS